MEKIKSKAIVISGVSLSEGGPLAIVTAVLNYLDRSEYVEEYMVYGLVHSKTLFPQYSNIQLLEYPAVKCSWFRRIWFEYYYCLGLSKKLNTFLWFSLHDMTPNTNAQRKAVYCHNASPFHRQKWSLFLKSPLRFLYTRYYGELYRINIKKNDFVVVQQQWMRKEFIRLFSVTGARVIVALPSQEEAVVNPETGPGEGQSGRFIFFYPAFPRIFKNFEVMCIAAEHLARIAKHPFDIILTLDGSENEYSGKIVEQYRDNANIRFIGLLSREEVNSWYGRANCLVFPSLLESWGLPISEFKTFNKPMLVADLPYAYETVGSYPKVRYFDPYDGMDLALQMERLMTDRIIFNGRGAIHYDDPVCDNWAELFKKLLA